MNHSGKILLAACSELAGFADCSPQASDGNAGDPCDLKISNQAPAMK